ncbi:MAG: choloylglycine hydrolase family protein [Desulfobacterales bacterium]|nr:MAG: choloylglycine hydrolase family protein [Desulfobacterales bacterium]UCD91133.1 MAG: choloylglycine hydrolase family protein [Desulfobacterales bacterium]
MKFLKCAIFVLATVMFLPFYQADACTGITLKGEDGAVVRSRTVEWGPFDLLPRLDIVPRGHHFSAEKMPDGKSGKNWKGKHGFVAASVLGKDAFVDGINETGLSAGMFYLPGFSNYPDYDSKKAKDTLAPTDLLGYILSQCVSIDEARKAVKMVHVAPIIEKALGFPAPLHVVVTEPSGKTIVIEFINKKLTIFEAPLGVITNSPTYDWHMTNLRNYINLSAISIPNKKVAGTDFSPLGAGSGMIGLPGDFTPPSRFVRAVAFSQSARKTSGDYDTVRESFRILDNFNIPADAAEGAEDSLESTDVMYSATQITTAADTKNIMFYYHTQFNRRIRMIDLKKIDFSKIGSKIISQPANKSHDEDILDLTPAK